MIEKLGELIEKIKGEQKELKQKRKYMNEHKFKLEANHITTKIKMIDEILYGLDSVVKDEDITNVKFEF